MKKSFWILPFLIVLPAIAVIPQFWEVRTYDEFRQGKLNGLSIRSGGELVLAPRFDLLFDTRETLIFDAAADSIGNVFLGTGHDGKIYRLDSNGNGEVFSDLEELDVLALAVDLEDRLFAATSPGGKVYRIERDGSKEIFFDPEAKYIWSLVFGETGDLFVATGNEGIIYVVSPDGEGRIFYDSEEIHIITMAFDSKGNLFAGGNPKGYIYKISKDGRPFVLYDSGMQEVHSLVLGEDETIYAAMVNSVGTTITSNSSTTPPAVSEDSTVSVTISPGSAATAIQRERIQSNQQPTTIQSSSFSANGGLLRSALLELNSEGVVTTLWKSSNEMIFAILPHDKGLLFSTDSKGRIYNYEGTNRTTLLVESSEEQTTHLLSSGARIYASSSNVGKLFELKTEVASSGQYESNVKNTEATSSWGKVTWKGATRGVQILTRTGNTGNPDSTWSDWMLIGAAGEVFSPNARFIQWKAELNREREDIPVLSSVRVPFLQQNFRPAITSLFVLPSGVGLQKIQTANNVGVNSSNGNTSLIRRIPPRRIQQKGVRGFQWTANDLNNDTLTYSLHYKEENEEVWKILRADLEDPFYTLPADALPDGIYVFRVVANDKASNPFEIALADQKDTVPFAIDNSPPLVRVSQESLEGSRVHLHVEVEDETSTLKQAEVSVDGNDWSPIFPVDGILDSLTESFDFSSIELSSGEHTIAFRMYDQNENVGMGKIIARIP